MKRFLYGVGCLTAIVLAFWCLGSAEITERQVTCVAIAAGFTALAWVLWGGLQSATKPDQMTDEST